MLAIDRSAVMCDLAETYQIYDYRSLPAQLVATFAAGLRENSRIRMIIRGDKLPYTEALLAKIYDRLTNFIWAVYGSGEAPGSILDYLYGVETEPDEKDTRGFDSTEEFDRARLKFIEGGK